VVVRSSDSREYQSRIRNLTIVKHPSAGGSRFNPSCASPGSHTRCSYDVEWAVDADHKSAEEDKGLPQAMSHECETFTIESRRISTSSRSANTALSTTGRCHLSILLYIFLIALVARRASQCHASDVRIYTRSLG
jgi:hypothetical protein